jgi:hypothetical protein
VSGKDEWSVIAKGEAPPTDGSLVWVVWEEIGNGAEPERCVELAESWGEDVWKGRWGGTLDTENGRVTHWQYATLPPLPEAVTP